MKKFIALIIGVITLVTACGDNAAQASRQKYAHSDTYLVDIEFEGHTHQFVWYSCPYNSGPVGHWPDCKYCKGEGDGDYNGIKANTDSYVNEVVELLKAKDAEIASLEAVVKAQNE